nr:hypothetical protein [Tanacetum cinerariifolium]
SIKYALTVNPNIYVSVIKQFWPSVAVKKVNDVSRLQAFVDRKKVIITEATIRDALRLDDAEGIECLPNEEIFTELARIGKQVGDLSSHTTKYSSPALIQKVFANMRSVGKRCSKVETPLFEGIIVARQVGESAAEVYVEDVSTTGVAAEGAASVADDEVPIAIDKPSIPSPSPPLPPPPSSQDIPSTSQGRIITDMDADKDVTLKDVAVVAKNVQDAEIEEIIRDPKKSATPSTIIHTEAESKDKGKGIMVEEPKLLKKQAQIKQDEAYAKELEAELNKNIDWDEVIDHVQRKEKEDNAMKRYQALKRKPQTEAQARKNIMIYLRNVVGFKMDYFKGMTYDDIRPIFEKKFNSNVAFLQKTKEQMDEEDSKALKRLSESQEDKTAKKQKLNEEVAELKRNLQIVSDDEDDVYTEAIPLARKVLVVDYEIYTENNKPYYKIIRANGSPRLFLSFLSLLRNFDREDLEVH